MSYVIRLPASLLQVLCSSDDVAQRLCVRKGSFFSDVAVIRFQRRCRKVSPATIDMGPCGSRYLWLHEHCSLLHPIKITKARARCIGLAVLRKRGSERWVAPLSTIIVSVAAAITAPSPHCHARYVDASRVDVPFGGKPRLAVRPGKLGRVSWLGIDAIGICPRRLNRQSRDRPFSAMPPLRAASRSGPPIARRSCTASPWWFRCRSRHTPTRSWTTARS